MRLTHCESPRLGKYQEFVLPVTRKTSRHRGPRTPQVVIPRTLGASGASAAISARSGAVFRRDSKPDEIHAVRHSRPIDPEAPTFHHCVSRHIRGAWLCELGMLAAQGGRESHLLNRGAPARAGRRLCARRPRVRGGDQRAPGHTAGRPDRDSRLERPGKLRRASRGTHGSPVDIHCPAPEAFAPRNPNLCRWRVGVPVRASHPFRSLIRGLRLRIGTGRVR